MPSTQLHTIAFLLLLVSAGITHVACAESTDRMVRPSQQIVGVWCVESTAHSLGAVTFDFRKNGLLVTRWREEGQSSTEPCRVHTARWSASGKLIKVWSHNDKQFGGSDWTAEIAIDGNKFSGRLRCAENADGLPVTGKRSFSQYLR